MNTGKFALKIRIAFLGLSAMLWSMPVAAAHGSSDPARRVDERITAQLQAVVTRLDALERENLELRGQVLELRQKLESSTQEIPKVRQEARQELAPLEHRVAAVEKERRELPFAVGFRTGWAESPYDMPGGFFYSAYLNHRLLTQEDGIPAGYVSGELMAGLILGNHAVSGGNLASKLGLVGPVSSWMNTVEIQPTVQYHLDLAAVRLKSLEVIKPYVLAGPAIWISQMSTPVVNGKGPGEKFRHYDADTQAGGVYGLGFELALSRLAVPAIQGILDKSFVGAEWRYNEMANGEQFQQYSGSVSFGF